MLKKETLDKITGFGFDTEKLIAAIKDDKEVDYEIPAINVISTTDLETRDANKLLEGKRAGEKESRIALVKEVGTRLNISLKGERIADLVNEIQTEFNKGGDQKITSLQEQVNLLTKDKTTLAEQLTSEKTRASQAIFESNLIGHFPTNRSKVLTDSERLGIIKNTFQFEEIDGKPVAKKNGEVLKDANTHAPLPIDKVIGDYFTERQWVEAAAGGGGGRGGGNSGGGGTGGAKNFSQAKAEWLKANPDGNPVSPEFMSYVDKLAKADTTFNMSE